MMLLDYKELGSEPVKQLFVDVFGASEGMEEGLAIGGLVSNLIATTPSEDIFGFIATEDKQLVGSIFFTRMTFDNGINAFILSPVAIATSAQGKGVGQALINFGINVLREHGVALLLTYGDPAYYGKVGFKPISEQVVKAPQIMSQPEGWLGQSLLGEDIVPIAGCSACVEALNKPEYW
ncbi:GNAT family N-acetyltransferase [Oceanicoccus sagamiensis]|uniref:GNAT family N-acetyltransferase n=1 Tax=Oceanicoccus sagamiensis TaxID=716816 RepID=A0A1X9NFU0_9GAMM|nr:N-acetyltransferase [Oceanicoccus sagamiensis]ARN72873.1 GNAT family N-acetyltransferase [Oceanicoccus sagamiensis]